MEEYGRTTPLKQYIMDLVLFLCVPIQSQLERWGELRDIREDDIIYIGSDYIVNIINEDISVKQFDYLIETVFPETFDRDFESMFPALLKKFKSWIVAGYEKDESYRSPELNIQIGADPTPALDLLSRAYEKGIAGLSASDGIPLTDDTPRSLVQSMDEYMDELANAYNFELESGWISAEDAEKSMDEEIRKRNWQMKVWIICEKLKLEYDFIKKIFNGNVPQLMKVAETEPSDQISTADIGVPENCIASDFTEENPVEGIDTYTDIVFVYTGIGSFDQAICWKSDELEKLMNDPTNIYYECEGDHPPDIDDTGVAYVGSTAPAGNSTFIRLSDYKSMLETVKSGALSIFYIVPILGSDGNQRTPRAVSLAYLLNLPGSAVSGKHCEPQDTMSLYEVRQFVKDSGDIDLTENTKQMFQDLLKNGELLEWLEKRVEKGDITDTEKSQLLLVAKESLSELDSLTDRIENLPFIGSNLIGDLEIYPYIIQNYKQITGLQEILGTDVLDTELNNTMSKASNMLTYLYNNFVRILNELKDEYYPSEYNSDLDDLPNLFSEVCRSLSSYGLDQSYIRFRPYQINMLKKLVDEVLAKR